MSASAREPGDPIRPAQSDRAVDAAAGAPTPDRDLFDQVLEETRTAFDADKRLDVAAVAALHEVARRHRRDCLNVDPVLLELVESILQVRFPGLWRRDTYWTTMARQVAETLFEDPSSRARLDLFWSRLLGAA